MSNDNTIGVRITGDASDLQQALKQASTSIEGFSSQAVSANTKTADSFTAVSTSTKRLAPEIADALKPAGKEVEILGNKAGEGAKKVAAGYQQASLSAKQLAFAQQGLPAQFTDIVVSLQGGQAPLTVLLQQGGQLKDMFGGIGPAFKAIGGYVMSTVNPYTVAAAAVGALALAHEQGANEMRAFQNASTLAGDAVGVSASQFSAMTQSMASISGTRGKAAEVLTEIASTGQLAGANIEKIGMAAILMEKATGQAVGDTIKQFAKLADEPVKASADLNKQYNYLTASVYEQIKALEEQGNKEAAANLAQQTYADAMAGRTQTVINNAGLMERAWNGVAGGAKRAWDAMLNVGRADTAGDQLAGLEAKLARRQAEVARFGNTRNIYTGASDQAGIDRIKQEINYLQETIRMETKAAQGKAETARVNAAGIAAIDAVSKANDQAASKQDKMNKALDDYRANINAIRTSNPDSALLDPKKIAAAEAGIREQYKETAKAKHAARAPVTTGESEVASIRAKVIETQHYIDTMKAQGLEAAKQTEGEKLVIKINQDLLKTLSGVARANKEKALTAAQSLAGLQKESVALETLQKAHRDFEKDRDKEISGQEADILKLEQKAQAMEDQVRLYGMSEEALVALSIARLQERADILAGFPGSEQQIGLIEKEIAARKRLALATDAKDGLDAGVKAAKAADAEWKRTATSIENTLTDSLMRAFEGGKGFAQAMRDTITNMFKTMVLRPIIQAVMSPISIGIGSALGLPGAANAATGGAGGGGNLLGLASNASSLYSSASSLVSIGSQVFAGTMSVANALGTVAANATGTGISGLLAANGAYGTAAAGSASALAGSATAAMAAVPVWGWATMAAVAVASLFGGRGKKESTGSGITGSLSASGASVNQYADWKQDGGWFHSDRTGRELSAVGGELQKVLDTSVTGITSATKLYAAALGLSADAVNGFAQDITISLAGLDAKAQQEAIEKALGGFADGMASVYGGITLLSKDGEGASATLARLSTSLVTTNAWLSMLRQRVLQVGLAGADAASKLADTFGGLEQMGSAVQAYYALYFTETERAAYSTQQMTAALAALGIAMPATKDAFRAVADSLDLNTEAGRKAYAVLLTIAPEFAAVADQTAKLAQETATRLLDTFSGRQQLIPLLNTTLARFDALGDGLDGTAASTLNMGNATGWINTRLGDASSGLLFFGDRVTGLTQPLTNAQTKALALATGLTEAQIKAGALTTGAGLLGVSLDATKLKAAALATGMSESQIKALALTAATGTLASQLTATQTKALALATGLTEAQIKAGALTAGMIALGSPLSGAQLAALSLSEQILALKLNASRTVTDIVGLSAALASVNTETFMATMQGVLAKLGDMFSGVLGDINSERIAVRDAALAIINPSVMSKDQIQRGIAGANVGMPTNAALVRANSALVAADAYLDNAKGQLYAAQAKSENTISALNGVMTAQVADYKSTASYFQNTAVGYKIRVNAGSAPNNDAYGYNAATNRLNGFAGTSDATTSGRAYKHYLEDVRSFMNVMTGNGTLAKLQNANAVLASSEKSIADARAAGAAEIAAYKRTFDAATATQTAAVTVARNAQLAYIDSLQNYAIDASKATAKLGKLREETVKYYESQKQLADLMSTSAATLRKTVADYRYSQLTPEQQFRSLETQFNTAYSLALSTSGDTLAGYADQMSALLNPMLEKMQEAGYDPSGSQSAISAYLARAEAIATRVNALTPVNYAADSLAMLGQIDSTLAALEAGSKSAERIISDAINAGRDATVGGLRQVVNALTGRGVTYFADGGAFTNGIATGPTAFNMGMMGEAGPEGILPLTNVGGKLGVHALGGNGNNNAELVAELRALRQDNANMRAELRAIASSNNKTARILDRIEKDGLIVRTDEDTPLSTVAA